LKRQSATGVNELDIEAVLFEMAGVVRNPWNSLIDGDRAIGDPQRCPFAGFGTEQVG
jgi:hypothetical protein